MTDTFCSDIVALFFNHIWECPDCLDKVGCYLLGTFAVIGLISTILSILTEFFFSLAQKIAYRRSYKEKYDTLGEEYDQLARDFIALSDEYLKLKNQ